MNAPNLVIYDDIQLYRTHYHRKYCHNPINTYDGIKIRFNKQQFDHCFFDSIHSKDDTFSQARAERIDWIEYALLDPKAELYVGYDKKKKKYINNRRVTVVSGNYVVVVQLGRDLRKGNFITAFLADSPRTLRKIRTSPRWSK